MPQGGYIPIKVYGIINNFRVGTDWNTGSTWVVGGSKFVIKVIENRKFLRAYKADSPET